MSVVERTYGPFKCGRAYCEEVPGWNDPEAVINSDGVTFAEVTVDGGLGPKLWCENFNIVLAPNTYVIGLFYSLVYSSNRQDPNDLLLIYPHVGRTFLQNAVDYGYNFASPPDVRQTMEQLGDFERRITGGEVAFDSVWQLRNQDRQTFIDTGFGVCIIPQGDAGEVTHSISSVEVTLVVEEPGIWTGGGGPPTCGLGGTPGIGIEVGAYGWVPP
jgi:hypothetical protein